MKIRKNHLALWVAMVLLFFAAACNDDDISSLPEASQDFLAGTWTACFNLSSDIRQTLEINGAGIMSIIMTGYSSTDTSCSTGAGAPSVNPGTYTLGGNVSATLTGGTVTARIWDYTISGTNYYSIVYVDFGANPDRLYAGDPPGSTPVTRPTNFLAFPYLRQ